jgi:hypothetical protein
MTDNPWEVEEETKPVKKILHLEVRGEDKW